MFGARWLLAKALQHPGSKFLAMGVDFQKARDTTYPKLFAQLPGERTTLTMSGYNGPENSPLVADYNRQHHRLTLTNDSVITLGSADKYSRYAWRAGSTIYEHLEQLEDAGYITGEQNGRRKTYSLTERGELTLQAERAGED